MSRFQSKDDIIDIDEQTVRDYKKMSVTELKNYAVMQVIKASLEDKEKYNLAVDTLECLMVGDLPDSFDGELKETYDSLSDYEKKGFARVKFKMLLRHIKRMTPTEIEGKL